MQAGPDEIGQQPWLRSPACSSAKTPWGPRVGLGHPFADVLVVSKESTDLIARLERATRDLKRLDWRLHEVLLVPVERLTPEVTR